MLHQGANGVVSFSRIEFAPIGVRVPGKSTRRWRFSEAPTSGSVVEATFPNQDGKGKPSFIPAA
jgi:hypothetical protein